MLIYNFNIHISRAHLRTKFVLVIDYKSSLAYQTCVRTLQDESISLNYTFEKLNSSAAAALLQTVASAPSLVWLYVLIPILAVIVLLLVLAMVAFLLRRRWLPLISKKKRYATDKILCYFIYDPLIRYVLITFQILS